MIPWEWTRDSKRAGWITPLGDFVPDEEVAQYPTTQNPQETR